MKSVLLTPFHLDMQHEIQCIPLRVHLVWQTWSPPPSCPAPHPTSVLKPTDVTGAVPALGTSDLVAPGQATPLQPYLILNSVPKSCPKCHCFTEVSVTVTLPHFHSLLERAYFLCAYLFESPRMSVYSLGMGNSGRFSDTGG